MSESAVIKAWKQIVEKKGTLTVWCEVIRVLILKNHFIELLYVWRQFIKECSSAVTQNPLCCPLRSPTEAVWGSSIALKDTSVICGYVPTCLSFRLLAQYALLSTCNYSPCQQRQQKHACTQMQENTINMNTYTWIIYRQQCTQWLSIFQIFTFRCACQIMIYFLDLSSSFIKPQLREAKIFLVALRRHQ